MKRNKGYLQLLKTVESILTVIWSHMRSCLIYTINRGSATPPWEKAHKTQMSLIDRVCTEVRIIKNRVYIVYSLLWLQLILVRKFGVVYSWTKQLQTVNLTMGGVKQHCNCWVKQTESTLFSSFVCGSFRTTSQT